jgi:hypothetical protein
MDVDTDFDNTVFVCTVLPEKPPRPYNACSARTLDSGRSVIEHVWGHPASGRVQSDVPCCCGLIKYGELRMRGTGD